MVVVLYTNTWYDNNYNNNNTTYTDLQFKVNVVWHHTAMTWLGGFARTDYFTVQSNDWAPVKGTCEGRSKVGRFLFTLLFLLCWRCFCISPPLPKGSQSLVDCSELLKENREWTKIPSAYQTCNQALLLIFTLCTVSISLHCKITFWRRCQWPWRYPACRRSPLETAKKFNCKTLR